MMLGCPSCGALQEPPSSQARETLACATCGSVLDYRTGRSLDAALACAFGAFVLLAPANFLPFLTTSILGVSRQSRLVSSATSMWSMGRPSLALAIGLFIVVAPALRFGLLSLVLGALKLGRRPPWLGRAFRWANALQLWAMADVFVLALWVAYARLTATLSVQVGAGAVCFIGVGVLTLFTRATLDKRAVWAMISPQASLAPGVAVISCLGCDLLAPAEVEGRGCPRCRTRLWARKPNAVASAAALTVAGLILYLPANLYPIATIPIGLTPTAYTVLEGVKDLVDAHLLGLALLVFCASFLIPFVKLAGISWVIVSVLRRSNRALRAKTRTYRIVEEIGRWSMVDPFVIACFVPVTQFNAAISSAADLAAPFFTGVVVVTIIAARRFDPRLMWDVAGHRA